MKSKTVIKQVRKQYSPEFRKQALVRADGPEKIEIPEFYGLFSPMASAQGCGQPAILAATLALTRY